MSFRFDQFNPSDPYPSGETTGQGAGTASFNDTFVLSSLIPTDAYGNEVLGAQFSSESGTEYSTGGVILTPESSTTPVLLIGMALVFWGVRRKDRLDTNSRRTG
jgi:hypothetical protein